MKEIVGNNEIKIRFKGMRVLKTVISVHLCFLIGIARNTLPFYSAIAAILCTQSDYSSSIKVGKSRIIGTLIGGIYGFLAIVCFEYLNIKLFGYSHYLILSLFLIPIIYTNVYLKVPSSVYLSCVVFLIMTVTNINNIGPLSFAFNRIVDTLIGIFVSLAINLVISKKTFDFFNSGKS